MTQVTTNTRPPPRLSTYPSRGYASYKVTEWRLSALGSKRQFPSRQMPSASCIGRSEIENTTDSFDTVCE
jgi:hypothetical protein